MAAGATVAAVGWVTRALARRWRWRRFRSGEDRKVDPVRMEAGRWLRKIADGGLRNADCASVQRELERLRYGARSTWAEPEKVFRRAGKAWREKKGGRKKIPF